MRALLSSMVLLGSTLTGHPAEGSEVTKTECVAANSDAQDLRREGRLGAAREKLAICASKSCPGPVREDCTERLDEIATAMPSIIFELKDDAGHDSLAVTITMDGQALAANGGSTIELDPGEHTFTFEAQGHPKVEKRLVIAEGMKQRRELIVIPGIASRHRHATDPGGSRAFEHPTRTSVLSRQGAPAPSSGPPTLAWTAFGVGGVGLSLGVIAGFVASGKHSTLAGECDGTTKTCAPEYARDLDTFHTWRTVSTVGYVIGALGVAGGATLWLAAPKTKSTTMRAWVGPASAGIGGRF